MQGNTLFNTYNWFTKAVPEPAAKNLHTQMGVHFEEVSEMLDEVHGHGVVTRDLLDNASNALQLLAHHLKNNDSVISIPAENRINYLDALCDQIVTATGCARMSEMNLVDAMDEVNDSNFSKFDNTGNPIFDENMKVAKGPNYRKANLKPFC